MLQEKKNCKECGILFTPGPNNSEYCPEHKRKKRSIFIRCITAVGGVLVLVIISILSGGKGGGNSKA